MQSFVNNIKLKAQRARKIYNYLQKRLNCVYQTVRKSSKIVLFTKIGLGTSVGLQSLRCFDRVCRTVIFTKHIDDTSKICHFKNDKLIAKVDFLCFRTLKNALFEVPSRDLQYLSETQFQNFATHHSKIQNNIANFWLNQNSWCIFLPLMSLQEQSVSCPHETKGYEKIPLIVVPYLEQVCQTRGKNTFQTTEKMPRKQLMLQVKLKV